MLLGFKRQFADFVEEGSKMHTIRGKRKIRPKIGETAHCYVDPRQKTMRLLGRFQVVKVDDIRIEVAWVRGEDSPMNLYIWINDTQLLLDEVNALAWRDGFRDGRRGNAWERMACFWRDIHGCKPFVGDLIHWHYKAGTNSSDKSV